MQQKWLHLTARLSPQDADRFVELCWDLQTIGLQEQVLDEELVIDAFFAWTISQNDLYRDLLKTANQRQIDVTSVEIQLQEGRTEDWLEKWKREFTGFAVGDTFYIHPDWEAPSSEHEVNLLIEPGHAFGTGTHESTQLCLLALEKLVPDCRRFLDVGTGSGILSIAAARLNRGLAVTAIDIDSQATEMAKENFRRNGIDGVQLVAAGPEVLRGRFDFVAANLTLEILKLVSHHLARLCNRYLLISGVTEEQAPFAEEIFAGAGFRSCKTWVKTGWACILFRVEEPGDQELADVQGDH